jgi:hypothetical protein
MSHWRLRIHKTHHDPDAGEATTFPHIVYSTPLRGSGIWMAFCHLGVPKLPRLGVSQLCETITYGANLRLIRGLNQSCSPHQELSNDVLHATCTQGNWVDSRPPVVGRQIASLTPGLSFGHNLCCKCPNGPCEPILDI